MTTDDLPTGPDPEAITRSILDAYPETATIEAGGTTFFSLDAEKHFPNFATIVTNDDYDDGSDLGRPGVFRLNLGVDRETFERLIDPNVTPDYTALDRIIPHPEYAAQRWISILNPGTETFEEIVRPLIAVAHDRLAAQRARHGLDRA